MFSMSLVTTASNSASCIKSRKCGVRVRMRIKVGQWCCAYPEGSRSVYFFLVATRSASGKRLKCGLTAGLGGSMVVSSSFSDSLPLEFGPSEDVSVSRRNFHFLALAVLEFFLGGQSKVSFLFAESGCLPCLLFLDVLRLYSMFFL